MRSAGNDIGGLCLTLKRGGLLLVTIIKGFLHGHMEFELKQFLSARLVLVSCST